MSLCLDLDAQRHTTGAARVEGKKVVQQHVPQHVFVPHDSLFLHLISILLLLCMLGQRVGKMVDPRQVAEAGANGMLGASPCSRHSPQYHPLLQHLVL